MHIINPGPNDTLFVADGLPYRKGQYEVYYTQEGTGTIVDVGIRNINSLLPIVSPVPASQYVVSSATYTDIDVVTLVTNLSVVLGFNMGGGGIIEETDPVYLAAPASNITTDNISYLEVAGFQLELVSSSPFILNVNKSVVLVTLLAGATTVELPLLVGDAGRLVIIVNTTGIQCTITANASDGNAIWEGDILSSSINLDIGGTIKLMNDTQKYRII